MAVIFAVVGGGAVIGVISSPSYDEYDNYYDHSDYSNYSNYSDAAERRKRRQSEKQSEIDSKKYEINTYKSDNVNSYLNSSSLINQSGVSVSISEVKKDGDTKINKEQDTGIVSESAGVNAEMAEIDKVIDKIDKILKEG